MRRLVTSVVLALALAAVPLAAQAPVKKKPASPRNTPMAISHLHELATRLNKATGSAERSACKGALLAAGRVLGLLQQEPEAWFRWQPAGGAALDESAIADFIRRRQEARKSRNFAEADRIREELAGQGILLEDGPQGTIWRRKD